MKSVWVIEQGSYSDYRVCGVFTSQANARMVADAINKTGYDEATIAEWPLDPSVRELSHGLSMYNVHMLKDGSVERCEKTDLPGYQLSTSIQMWRRTKAPAYIGKGIPDILTASVWAKNDKHAIKITNEHRSRMIADGTWHKD